MLLEQLNSNITGASIDSNNNGLLATAQQLTSPKRERRHAEFFDVIGTSLNINSPEQFCAWAENDLQHIFPHGILISGIGLIQNQGAQIHNLLSCNLPQEYLQTLHQNGGMSSSPVFAQWLKTRRPVLFELSKQRIQSAWLDNFERHGLVNMATHGQCDLNSDTTSYFSFSKVPGNLTSRHSSLLDMLVPHLHVALIRAFKGANKETTPPKTIPYDLTEREYEVLKWMGSGKTNWEIAQVLNLSEFTIKSHVRRIFSKLKVNSRTQAVSKLSNLA